MKNVGKTLMLQWTMVLVEDNGGDAGGNDISFHMNPIALFRIQ